MWNIGNGDPVSKLRLKQYVDKFFNDDFYNIILFEVIYIYKVVTH